MSFQASSGRLGPLVRRQQLRVGDVFSIAIDENRSGVGQIVGTYGKNSYYFAIFDAVSGGLPALDVKRALGQRVIFLALSLDAKLAAGHWIPLGHFPVRDEMPLPAYKEEVGGPGRIDVVDFSGERRRPASDREAAFLPNRTIVARVRLERALRARHGLEPWNDAYSELTPNESTTTERLFP